MTIWIPQIGERRGPKYLAIADALAEDIANGTLTGGTRLPPQRDLAHALGITLGTVTRAYAEAKRRGLISGEVGRGSYVLGEDAPSYDVHFGIDEAEGGLINMALNLPAAGSSHALLQDALRGWGQVGFGPGALGFQQAAGSTAHREKLAGWLTALGLPFAPDRLLITAGAMNGLLCSLMAICGPGETVLAEELTFPGIKFCAERLGLRLHGLPMDEEGIQPDAFEAACRATGARVLYTVPTIQNTTGAVMSDARRRQIAGIAKDHGVMIIEDDVYGFHQNPYMAPIACLYPEGTFYLNSTSKILAEGLRIGAALVPPTWVERVSLGVQASVYFASTFATDFVCHCIDSGVMEAAIQGHHAEIQRRQTRVRQMLDAAGVHHRPSGYITWAELPAPWRAEEVVSRARDRGVQLIGPAPFAIGRRPRDDAMRLAFGKPDTLVDVERGIGVFIDILRSSDTGGGYLV
ncbi:MAG: PLP-dependent aminotransferase family protein [Magnetospiraceae bacterium]